MRIIGAARGMIPAALLPLAACDKISETYEGLTAPIVAEGLIMGVEAPQSDTIDLSETEWAEGTGATVFLATAEAAADLENAPLTDATVTMSGPGIGNVALANLGAGGYGVEPNPNVVYEVNATWTISAEVLDDTATAQVLLPPPANITIPEQHAPNTALSVDLGGQGYTAAIVVVIDNQAGSVTYSNQPQDIRGIYDMGHSTEDVGVVEIPATAFPAESVYAVGVAGLTHTTAEDLDFMNIVLSSIMAGKMRMFPVVTATIPS